MRCTLCNGKTRVRKTKQLNATGLNQVVKRTHLCVDCGHRHTSYQRYTGSKAETALRAALKTHEATRLGVEHIRAALQTIDG